MIKLFSLNHTRTRKLLILAQDKTQFRRVTVLIFRIRNTSARSEEHTSELQSRPHLVCRLLPEIPHRHPTSTLVPYTTLFRSKHPLLPLDLHVLSLPPAFNLSHDQTLQFKSYKNP